jgi:uncharacterized protein YdaU (DUF1376 family)
MAMSKDPAFLFYPNDFMGGTMGMSFEEKGAYIELLVLQFNRGHMTTDMVGRTVGQLWGQLKDKFTVDDQGLFYNERLDLEMNKRKTFIDSRKNNLSGKNQYSKEEEVNGHMDGQVTSLTEDVNRNVNKIDNVINEEVENLYNEVVPFFDENTRPKTDRQKRDWCDTLDKLMRIDGHQPEYIKAIIAHTRADNFWKTNFLSVLKLRKKNSEQIMYFTVFEKKIINGAKKTGTTNEQLVGSLAKSFGTEFFKNDAGK